MVKGISRQVIVVKSPDPKLFEQAIFILREDALGQGLSDKAILRQAQQAADGYLAKKRNKGGKKISGAVYALGGAFVTGLVWALTLLL